MFLDFSQNNNNHKIKYISQKKGGEKKKKKTGFEVCIAYHLSPMEDFYLAARSVWVINSCYLILILVI